MSEHTTGPWESRKSVVPNIENDSMMTYNDYLAQRAELQAGLCDAIFAAMRDMGPRRRHISLLSSTAGEAVEIKEETTKQRKKRNE